MSKTKTTKKPAKSAKSPASQKGASKPEATPATELCANGHTWDTDGEGVEFCTVCKADRKEVEKGEKKKAKAKQAGATKPAQGKKAKSAGQTKVSALDAAAKVLAESDGPMNTKAMIEAMATKGYWTSPGGKTPHATLYSAILTEINKKGKEARFKKTDRGQFTLTS